MNIKEAEEKSGVERQNIRFYEKQGLIHPARNRWNAYRDYGEKDVRTLKMIRMMRMLNTPLEEIRKVLKEETTLSKAAEQQQERLETETAKLSRAISFCKILKQEQCGLAEVDVDNLLDQMKTGETQDGYFTKWITDYQKVKEEMHQEKFSFIPDGEVTSPETFTKALFEYAKEQKKDLVITKEGMYPEFVMDGVEYRAERIYTYAWGLPVVSVKCEMMYPEKYRTEMPEGRRWKMRFLNRILPAVVIELVMAVIIFSHSRENAWLEFLIASMIILVNYFWFQIYFGRNRDR